METMPDAAVRIWTQSSALKKDAAKALAQIETGNFTHLVSVIPIAAYGLGVAVLALQAKGWGADILGPKIFELVDGNSSRSWEADYSAKYDLFKDAVTALAGAITAADPWSTNHDANGDLLWDVAPSAEVQADLITKLTAVVDNFPEMVS